MKNSTLGEPVHGYTAGPVDAYPAVLRAMSAPLMNHNDPAFQAFYQRTSEKLQTAMRAKEMPVILHGAMALGLEAAAASLLGEQDVLLNLSSGYYGRAYKTVARRFAREIVEIDTPSDTVIDPDAVRETFRKRPDIKVVSVVHVETPVGSVNPVAEIGKIAHDHGALMVVDAATSWAGMSCGPDESNADVFVAGPHKCLGGAPGLSLLGVSAAAWSRMEKNTALTRGSMLSILDWRNAWKATERFPVMPSITEMYGLSAALDLYLDEGDEAIWARHVRVARIFRAGLRGMGLNLWVKDDANGANTAIAVRMPEGVPASRVQEAARRVYGVNFSSSQGEADRALVVALMGRTAQPIHAMTALTALGGALSIAGAAIDVGAGVNAALVESRT